MSIVAKKGQMYSNEKITSIKNSLLIFSFLFQMITCVAGLAVPIYAVHLGATPIIIGVIGATGGALYSFMPAISGILSDKFGRKTFISLSTLLYSISCLLYLLAKSPYALIPLRALEAFSMALFWPSLEALLTSVSENGIKRNLRKFNLSWGAAMMIGPAISGFLISALGVKASLLVSSILSIALFLIITMKVSEVRKERTLHLRYGASGLSRRWLPSISTAAFSTLLLSFAAGIIFNIFPAHASKLGIPAHEIGLMIFIVGLFRLLAFLEAYQIENLVGRANMFLIGSILMVLASALLVAGYTIPLISISLSIAGFSIGLLYAASIAVFLEGGRGMEGQAAGLFECLLGIGFFFGPLLGGLVAELSSEAPYILTSLFAMSISLLHIPRKLTKV